MHEEYIGLVRECGMMGENAGPFNKIPGIRDWQPFDFILGFSASFMSLLMLNACDEVIFCVSKGSVHAGACLAERVRPCQEM